MARRTAYQANKKSRAALIMAIPFLLAALLLLVVLSVGTGKNFALNAKGGATDPVHGGLLISEIMTSNKSAYPDENGEFGDWVEIWNCSDESVNLHYVGLSDRPDRLLFLFPDYVLEPDGRVTVFCDGTNRNAYDSEYVKEHPGERNYIFHAKFSLSSIGESVYLFNPSGKELDHVDIPTLNTDESYILVSGRGEEKKYEVTENYSPGYQNDFSGFEQYLGNFPVYVGKIVINEICPVPRSALNVPCADGDGQKEVYYDWIELRNLSDEDVYLDTFTLSDDPEKPYKWKFICDENGNPPYIPANGFYLVFCSGEDRMEEGTYIPHTNFSLSAGGETIVLSTVFGQQVDRVSYEDIGKDMSWGRDHNDIGSWRVFETPTPTLPNNSFGVSRADEYQRAKNTSGVYISEILSSSDRVLPMAGESACDWVEIYNSSENVVDLSGWGLSDNIGWPGKWRFPEGVSIWPGECKIILLDKSTNPGKDASRLHASFAISRAGGEMMTLSDRNGNILDRIYVPSIPTDVSYGRTWGEGGFFYYDVPTPGTVNAGGFEGYVRNPSFLTESGLYSGEIYVEIDAPYGATVRYTTDGSVPTVDNGTVYEGPILVETTTVLRARAFEPGLRPSETATASYIMNTYHALRVVSLTVDPYDLWDENTGMLSDGPDAVKEVGKLPFKHTVYREYGKIARPGYVEVFEQGVQDENGNHPAVISQGVKVALQGDYSLDMPQKSFKLRAQASGGNKYFEYPLFPHRTYTSYKSFTLRNSGNDSVWTRLNDCFQTTLVDRYLNPSGTQEGIVDILTLDYEPCVVYLNGIYWGHYNMRERKDKYCICQYEGVSDEVADDINIIKGNYTVVQGSDAEYRAMIQRLKTSSPNTNAEDRAYLDENIDVESFLDWFAIEMFFGNSDPGNVMYYRMPFEGSKWKCVLFDLDYGMYNSSFDSPWSYLKEKGMGQQLIVNTVFVKILEVDEYRELFFRKIGNIYKVLTPETMYAVLMELRAGIEPEMKKHWNRWAEDKGWRLVNSDSPASGDGALRYWNERVARLTTVIQKRPYYIYTLFQKQFGLTDAQMEYYFGGPCPAKP